MKKRLLTLSATLLMLSPLSTMAQGNDEGGRNNYTVAVTNGATSYNATAQTTSTAGTAKTTISNIYSTSLESNDDDVRRGALESTYGVSMEGIPVWSNGEDKNGEINHQGQKVEYTPVKTLKELGYYAVNANRQDLIRYGIIHGDWQPLWQFEFSQSPQDFELIDGVAHHNKRYYNTLIRTSESGYNENEVQYKNKQISEERYNEVKSAYVASIRELKEKVSKAPGALTENGGVTYIESKYNDFNYNKKVYWGYDYANWYNKTEQAIQALELESYQKTALAVQANFDRKLLDAEKDIEAGIVTKEYIDKLKAHGKTPSYFPFSFLMLGEHYAKVIEQSYDTETAKLLIQKHGLDKKENY